MRTSSNRALLLLAQSILGDELETMVLVGGACVDLLVTDPGLRTTRGTADVDLLVEVATRLDLHEVERRLGRRGLIHPLTSDVPICRWTSGALVVDIMPTDPQLYGFGNRWGDFAYTTALHYRDEELTMRHASAPAFIALKIEAYRSLHRLNGGDPYASHDFGDILTVLDGRPEAVQEIRAAPSEVQAEITALFAGVVGGSLDEIVESHVLEPERIARVAGIARDLARTP